MWKNLPFSLFLSLRTVKPIEAVLRPKGLGLGADRSLALQAKKNTNSENGTKDEEELRMTKGTYCVVESGKYKGEFGQVSERWFPDPRPPPPHSIHKRL